MNKQNICYTYFEKSQTNMTQNVYSYKAIAGFMMFEFLINSKGTPDEVVTLVVHDNAKLPDPYFSSSGSVDINVNETSAVYALVDINMVQFEGAPKDVCFDYRYESVSYVCLTHLTFAGHATTKISKTVCGNASFICLTLVRRSGLAKLWPTTNRCSQGTVATATYSI